MFSEYVIQICSVSIKPSVVYMTTSTRFRDIQDIAEPPVCSWAHVGTSRNRLALQLCIRLSSCQCASQPLTSTHCQVSSSVQTKQTDEMRGQTVTCIQAFSKQTRNLSCKVENVVMRKHLVQVMASSTVDTTRLSLQSYIIVGYTPTCTDSLPCR